MTNHNKETASGASSDMVKDVDTTLVEFNGPDDSYNPLNWPMRKKFVTTIIYSLCTMGCTWASTIYNAGLRQIESQFHVGQEVALLGLTFYLLGNSLGPLIWAPFSEAYGRKVSTIILPMFGLMVFSFATAVAKDLQTILITRFFAGMFGVAPLSNVGGVLVDIWPATQRGAALLTWGIAVIAGPLIAPLVGGALVVNLPQTGWRWTEYTTGIIIAATLLLGLFLVDESSHPVLLARKADKIRHDSQNWAIHSKSQEMNFTFKAVAQKYLIVPLEMLVDPICFFINLYAAFVYAMIYLAITSFPIEFEETRRWNEVVGSLPFLALLVGAFLGAFVNLWGQSYYRKQLIASKALVIPEARLLPMIIGSFFFAPGLFIMGWTSHKDTHWIGFCIGAACVGLGFFTIFQSAINYLVDTYLMLAASALAANMFTRSLLAASFPLFSNALFHNLGLDWGMSLLGFISAVMIPIPLLFYKFGRTMRAKGRRSKMTFVA
ncbi:MFS general substrate transporter [Polychaeton citri CBS 116435]|uniref:Cercosporin MFS transporter CTB4 n=1 Tax=Polychaeton citri CBS 116435 TaxID=1314669 RepID=A0A9P4URM7_9PEZI|nr:MFS general substrate transporter [Polychaeton citri CBS 116435]